MPSKTLATDTLNGAIVTAPAVGTSEVWTVMTTPADTATATGLGATAPYDVIVDNEIVHVTAVNVGAKQLTLTRGYAGTTPATHQTGATLTHIVTGEYLNAADVRLGAPLAHSHVEGDVTSLTSDLAAKAPLASPALTGTPTAPTAAGGTNTTQVATTAFVLANAGGGGAGRTTFSNANYTILSTDKYVAQVGTLSAPRTATLPAANAVAAGYMLFLADESNTVTGTNTITLARAGADTINNGTSFVLAQPFKIVRLISDGTSKWTADLIFQATVVDFTANGTSVIPAGCQTVTLIAVAGGGGGGSGRRGAAGTVRGGGGAGAGGGSTVASFSAALLGGAGTTLTVTVGAGGVGNAGKTVDSTDGSAGGAAGNTSVTVGGLITIYAAASGGGGGGTTSGGSAGGVGGTSTFLGSAGGAGGVGTSAPAQAASSNNAAGPGGGGGGISAADAASAGAASNFGSRAFFNTDGVVAAGGTSGGGNGGTPASIREGSTGAAGGGGGGSSTTTAGGNGGNGVRGGGGGGGGASLNGFNSGSGGNGGDGFVRIIYQ